MTVDLLSLERTVKFHQNLSCCFLSSQQNKTHPDIQGPWRVLGIHFRLFLPSALAINTADEENYIGQWSSNFNVEQEQQKGL